MNILSNKIQQLTFTYFEIIAKISINGGFEMIGRLIFIRHGDAYTDIERNCGKLTDKGSEQIKKILPSLKKNIDPNSTLIISSSPILRSVQTAEIIANYIGNIEIKKFEWIASGDIKDLQTEIEGTNNPFCMIIIGHEPFLSYWSHQISGYRLPYDKGSAVCFEITSVNPLKAVPVWFSQPNQINFKQFDINNDNPIIKELQKMISFQIQEIFCAQKQFWKYPDDPQSVYHLLIKIQVLHSLLSFIKPLMKELEYVEVETQLNELIQKFSHMRELDLLSVEWKHLVSVHPEFSNILSVFLQTLRTEREEEKNRVYPDVFENMTYLLFKLLIWSKTGNIQEKDLQNLPTFKDLRWSVLATSS